MWVITQVLVPFMHDVALCLRAFSSTNKFAMYVISVMRTVALKVFLVDIIALGVQGYCIALEILASQLLATVC